MKKFICKIIGCRYKYFFTPSSFDLKRIDIRTCKCCNKVQKYTKLQTLYTSKNIWMNMVSFTKIGAEKYFKDKK